MNLIDYYVVILYLDYALEYNLCLVDQSISFTYNIFLLHQEIENAVDGLPFNLELLADAVLLQYALFDALPDYFLFY